jgi:hypothetical protein
VRSQQRSLISQISRHVSPSGGFLLQARNAPRLFEIALVFVRLDHVASVIVNLDHSTASNAALEETGVLR